MLAHTLQQLIERNLQRAGATCLPISLGTTLGSFARQGKRLVGGYEYDISERAGLCAQAARELLPVARVVQQIAMGHNQQAPAAQAGWQPVPYASLAFLPGLCTYGAPQKRVHLGQGEIAARTFKPRLGQVRQIEDLYLAQPGRRQTNLEAKDRSPRGGTVGPQALSSAIEIDRPDRGLRRMIDECGDTRVRDDGGRQALEPNE